MRWLTEDAVIECLHQQGLSAKRPSQSLVTVARRRVLVDDDPEGRKITGCPNYGLMIKPCELTLKVTAGYSDFLRIMGQRICLDTVTGLTDGTPPGTVMYRVRVPGQELVSEVAASDRRGAERDRRGAERDRRGADRDRQGGQRGGRRDGMQSGIGAGSETGGTA